MAFGRHLPRNDWEGDDFTPGAGGAYVTCMDTAVGRAVAWATDGRIDRDGSDYRGALSGQSGGLTLAQAADEVRRVAGLSFTIPSWTWDQCLAHLEAGGGLIVTGEYAALPRSYRFQDAANFNHAMWASHYSPTSGIRVWDPLDPDTTGYGRWFPPGVFEAFATSLGAIAVGFVPLQPIAKPPAKPQPPERTPTMSALADVATMRKLVGVYLALNGKLNAKQSAALATDLKTLDSDLAKLEASLTAAPAAPVATRVAGLEPTSVGGTVDLSSRSTDSYWYMRQLLALTRDPSLVGQLIGAWPVEATDTAKRFRAIASLVGEYLTLGPAIERFYPALANEDVRLAAVNAPHDINPVFAAGLAAANAEVDGNPNGFVNLGTDTTIRVITIANTPGTSWGQVAVSGRFGTVDVLDQ